MSVYPTYNWTCHRCGASVPQGCTHSCPTTAVGPASIPAIRPTSDERIAAALERIAAALEKQQETER